MNEGSFRIRFLKLWKFLSYAREKKLKMHSSIHSLLYGDAYSRLLSLRPSHAARVSKPLPREPERPPNLKNKRDKNQL
jgi:hypothetical protein